MPGGTEEEVLTFPVVVVLLLLPLPLPPPPPPPPPPLLLLHGKRRVRPCVKTLQASLSREGPAGEGREWRVSMDEIK